MMGTQLEGTLRGWNTQSVGVLRVGILRLVLQLGSVVASHEILGHKWDLG